MKHIILLLLLLPQWAAAQLHLDGATVRINSGATVKVNGNVSITGGGTLQNNGTLDLTGNFDNQAVYSYAGSVSKLVFRGNVNSTLRANGHPICNVELRKNNASLVLLDPVDIKNNLAFFNNNTFVRLDNFNLSIGDAGSISGATNQRFVLTNGSGALVKADCTTFNFPVGYNTGNYNPVVITESGGVDIKSVRCLQHAFEDGSSGNKITEGVVAASWLITESTPGGSNANLTFSWYAADEQNLFDRNNCAVADYTGGVWNSPAGSVAGGGPLYTQSRAGVTAFTHFLVGTPGAYATAAPAARSAADAAADDFGVFPNPARAGAPVFVQLPGDRVASIEIVDAAGAVVRVISSRENGLVRLDLPPALPAGAYLVRLKNEENRAVKKLIVVP